MSEVFGEDEGMRLVISAVLGFGTFLALFPFSGQGDQASARVLAAKLVDAWSMEE
jgi:hypothetical protein